MDTELSGETVTVTDRGGQSIQYQLIDGVHYFPTHKVELLKRIPSFKMRPDDVYFPGYPRTGEWVVGLLFNVRTNLVITNRRETPKTASPMLPPRGFEP